MMAQRKDMMRIIRQDAGFSAKLGFGGASAAGEAAGKPNVVSSTSADAVMDPKTVSPEVETVARPISSGGAVVERRPETKKETRDEEAAAPAQQTHHAKPDGAVTSSAARGQVVYVAVSLTARQARLAEIWAAAARCTVQFLIRRVAQGLRDQVFDDWERNGMPDVEEPRGTRGKYSTSVTLTLRPRFAAELAARHDPLGILGLARVMGPAFRARFQVAFDQALAKAKIQTTTEGDQK